SVRPASSISADRGAERSADRPLRALAWMTASAVTFSGMAVYVKRLAPVMPQFELVFFRSLINLAWVFVLMRARRETMWPKAGKPLLLFRGLMGFAGVV